MLSTELMAKRLVELRGTRTQSEVANAINISTSALGMYEQGRRVPRDEVKVSLARYYGTTIEHLFFANNVHD